MTTVQSFFIDIDYDPECQCRYVAETKLPGLILENINPGRLVSRLLDRQIWPDPKRFGYFWTGVSRPHRTINRRK